MIQRSLDAGGVARIEPHGRLIVTRSTLAADIDVEVDCDADTYVVSWPELDRITLVWMSEVRGQAIHLSV
jgi:hypothetical protein